MPEPTSTINSTEDDVQFLYQIKPIMLCQLCSNSLQNLSLEQRHAHYDGHFLDQQSVVASSSIDSANPLRQKAKSPTNANANSPPPRPKGNTYPEEQNVFWFQAQASVPPENFTPGLIPTLKRALNMSHAKGATIRATLCHEGATHVAQESWDRGWGCGYRNFLMVCTALINQTTQPLYFPLLDDPIPPGVRHLQYWIEKAWADGFDRDGAEDLRHKLVGTKKWIGTAELYVAFVSRGIPAKLVDFPKSERGPKAVTEWVMNYFSPPPENKQINAFNALKGANPVISTDRMPLVLQHSGHSRTVVGFEVNKKGEPNLLVFDPSRRPSREVRQAALAKYSLSSPSCSPSKNTKRPALNSLFDTNAREVKYVRGRLETVLSGLNCDSILIDDERREENLQETLDPDPIKIVNFFRVSQSKLGKKDRYQILYFPLDPPLDDNERWSRRVVTSEIVE